MINQLTIYLITINYPIIRYEGTKCPSEILLSNPSKRFKNTNCPFSLVIRLGKKNTQEFGSTIDIEWNHNHSIQLLHSLSFKDEIYQYR